MRIWASEGCKGVTATTRTLLNYWFRADHRLPNGEKFAYYPFQREAIETLVYLYEAAKVRRHAPMIETYAKAATQIVGPLRLLQYDDFPRYCLKMATGSGNAVLENDAEYARTSLIIAPNIIVFERLKLDFASGRIFRADPIIPPEFKLYWDVECYMRGDSERQFTGCGVRYQHPAALRAPRSSTKRQRAGDHDANSRRAAACADVSARRLR